MVIITIKLWNGTRCGWDRVAAYSGGVELRVLAVPGLPEFQAGDDLARVLGDALEGRVEDGDILAVTSKIVSKVEGRQVAAADREDAITAETVRLVAQRGRTRIVQNRQGLVLAAAGVDSSNTPDGTILLLPEDPDASARALCAALRERFGLRIGVVLTDTLGRAWRIGQTDVAIGAAGLAVVDDHRGRPDANGTILEATIVAVADEIAAAADLVKGKSAQQPVAIVRGLAHLVGDLDGPGAVALVRAPEDDLFRLGTDLAWDEGYRAGLRGSADSQ